LATTVTKQVLENGPRNYIASYQILSDGSFLDNYLAADPTSAGDMGVNIAGNVLYPGVHIKIWQLKYTIQGNVRVTWDATTPQDAWGINGFGKQDFKKQGGLYVPQDDGPPRTPIAGATGKIFFNVTEAASPLNGATIQMWLKKDIVQ
jgi:hypothetical protein